MERNRRSPWYRLAATAVLAAGLVATALPAQAQRWHDRHGWHGGPRYYHRGPDSGVVIGALLGAAAGAAIIGAATAPPPAVVYSAPPPPPPPAVVYYPNSYYPPGY